MTAVLKIEALAKRFGDVVAVDGITFEVDQGQVYGFLGPNGAGKTTTIGMALGLIHPSAGTVTIFGQPITPARNRALDRVGSLVGSGAAVVPFFSARRNVAAVAALHGVSPQGRVAEVLAQVGLTEAGDRRAGDLSTGMKQRLGLAMALVHHPELLILDEPTSGMDPAGMRDVRNLLRDVARQGVTVFLSSHMLHEVQQTCDRVAVLNKGQIVAEGAVEEMLNTSDVTRVRVADARGAAECLRTLPGAREVAEDGKWVTVAGVESEAAVAHLVQHGFVPAEVTTPRNDLEDLYMRLTQDAE